LTHLMCNFILVNKAIVSLSEALNHTAKTKKVFQTFQSEGLMCLNDRFQPIGGEKTNEYSEALKHTAKTDKAFQTHQSEGLLRFNDRFQPIGGEKRKGKKHDR